MINIKIIRFKNRRNDFALNYFAESFESEFHATEKRINSKGVGPEQRKAIAKNPRTLFSNQIGEDPHFQYTVFL